VHKALELAAIMAISTAAVANPADQFVAIATRAAHVFVVLATAIYVNTTV